jgi:hypothetical protein
MISQSRLRNRDCTHRLAQLSRTTKILPLEFNTGFPFRECAHGFLRIRHRLHSSGQGCTRILQDKHRLSFLYQNYTRVSCRLASLDHPQDSRIEWMRAPPHGLLRLFYLHAPGLTLVTLGTACVPPARVPPTTWEITCPSKRT